MGWNMSRWKHLPASMDPRVRHLVVQLRRAKDHSGLGMQALAVRTGYSRASWDRYLNGRSVPPREAVDAFARACDVDRERLLALYDVAVNGVAGAEETQGEGELGAAGREAGSEGHLQDGSGGRPRFRRVLVAGSAVVVAGVTLLALVLTGVLVGGDGDTDRNGPAQTGTSAERGQDTADRGEFVFEAGRDRPCPVRRGNDGLLYAGYTTTRTDMIGNGSVGWAVVEAQCLLSRHGLSPGIADGMFGSRTLRAVKRLQDRAHIVVDGIIGEDTWGVLRK